METKENVANINIEYILVDAVTPVVAGSYIMGELS